MENLSGKKLLVIGGSETDMAIINAAREMGIYTICCDGNTDLVASPAKKIADEAWNLNYARTELVAQKCRENQVDGVMAGYSEWRVLAASKISATLGKPFYVTEEQIELTRNKRQFKDECVKYGVPVPQDFCIEQPLNDEDREKIQYPVIVKPVDNGGRKGITVCHNAEELDAAMAYALDNSVSKKIVIESFIEGTELAAIYTIVDGEYSLSLVNEKHSTSEYPQLCSLTLTPTKYYPVFKKKADAQIRNFLKGIGAQNGVCFFQLIANDDDIRVFEMGYRLNGGDDWKIISAVNNINYLKMLIHYSLTGTMGDDISKDNCEFDKLFCSLIVYSHAGIIKEINFENIKDMESVYAVGYCKNNGMVIEENGTTHQKCGMITLCGNDMGAIRQAIDDVYGKLIITDATGKDLKFEPFDTKILK